MKRLLASILSLFIGVHAFAAEVPDITIPELKQAIEQKNVTLLDANGTASYSEGHIPGAADFNGHRGDLAKLLPSDKNALIVAYCGGPRCHAYQAAVDQAQQLGYTNIKHLSAGISGWKSAGEKTEAAKNAP